MRDPIRDPQPMKFPNEHTADLTLLREGVVEFDSREVGLPKSHVVARRSTLLALIAECEAARAHRCALPAGLDQALNSGDGVYRP